MKFDCYVCCHSTSSSSDCCSEWGQGEERRLRDHIGKLKTERSTVRGTVVELESCNAEPVVSRQPISLAEARKLDLETAVLMQVCLYVIYWCSYSSKSCRLHNQKNGVQVLRGPGDFSSAKMSIPAQGPLRPQGVHWLGCEPDHSPSSSVMV